MRAFLRSMENPLAALSAVSRRYRRGGCIKKRADDYRLSAQPLQYNSVLFARGFFVLHLFVVVENVHLLSLKTVRKHVYCPKRCSLDRGGHAGRVNVACAIDNAAIEATGHLKRAQHLVLLDSLNTLVQPARE